MELSPKQFLPQVHALEVIGGMNDEPKQDDDGRPNDGGSQLMRSTHDGLHPSPINSTSHLSEHNDPFAVPPPFAIEVDLNLLPPPIVKNRRSSPSTRTP